MTDFDLVEFEAEIDHLARPVRQEETIQVRSVHELVTEVLPHIHLAVQSILMEHPDVQVELIIRVR